VVVELKIRTKVGGYSMLATPKKRLAALQNSTPDQTNLLRYTEV